MLIFISTIIDHLQMSIDLVKLFDILKEVCTQNITNEFWHDKIMTQQSNLPPLTAYNIDLNVLFMFSYPRKILKTEGVTLHCLWSVHVHPLSVHPFLKNGLVPRFWLVGVSDC